MSDVDVHVVGQGLEVKLGDGWSVSGVMLSDGSISWLFEKGGQETPLRMSRQAMKAMLQIRNQLIWQALELPIDTAPPT